MWDVVRRALVGYVLGDISRALIKDAAEAVLSDGGPVSRSAMQMVAADASRDELVHLLAELAGELRLRLPSTTEAALERAREIVQRIVAGDVNPSDGVRSLWDLHERFADALPAGELDPFVYAASSLDELEPEERQVMESQIVAQASEYLARRHSGGML